MQKIYKKYRQKHFFCNLKKQFDIELIVNRIFFKNEKKSADSAFPAEPKYVSRNKTFLKLSELAQCLKIKVV